MKTLLENSCILLVLLDSFLSAKSQWTTVRPLKEIDYKFQSISRYTETSPGGDKKAWFTVMMQAPNNAKPQADDRLTWRKVSSGPGSDVSLFEAKLNTTFIMESTHYIIPSISLSAGNDLVYVMMSDNSSQEVQTTFRGNSCQLGIMKQQNNDGKVRFKIILRNCETEPILFPDLRENGNHLPKVSDYFTQTEVLTSLTDNAKYRTCTVDVAGIERDGFTFKVNVFISFIDDTFEKELFYGFLYDYTFFRIQ